MLRQAYLGHAVGDMIYVWSEYMCVEEYAERSQTPEQAVLSSMIVLTEGIDCPRTNCAFFIDERRDRKVPLSQHPELGRSALCDRISAPLLHVAETPDDTPDSTPFGTPDTTAFWTPTMSPCLSPVAKVVNMPSFDTPQHPPKGWPYIPDAMPPHQTGWQDGTAKA
eukprot:gene50120-33318_t